MIEKDIEKAVIDAIDALGISGLDVSGFWQSVDTGIVKDLERTDLLATLRVIAQPRRYDGFTSPKCEIAISLGLSVLVYRAPDGAALAAITEPILNLLQAWQRDITAVKNVFTSSAFVPSGLRLDGGNASFDRAALAWTVPMGFTLRGVVLENTSTETQGATT